ncbi:sulfotransferase domain-containing protein [Brumicola nitratireducens]|uniref:Sulfotransferase n=1 Tax=Glaciecola nitratireducens (strain JCM 12485 / KCTC 12276 / FR1064) TaxID=1085623 RepID=G4QM71_GLANF|nr:sulfotransferase domain-containing protein [Glaciecola nitratireducens]AEP30642.1 sulfotransferase [Glaciecola nitratireducens FR1064]
MRNIQKQKNKIVILGSGRSGTTWLAKLFDSCPDVMYFHEPDSINKQSGIPYLPRNSENDEVIRNAECYINQLFINSHNKTHGKRPFFPKNYRSSVAEFIFRSSVFSSKLFEKIGVNSVRVLTVENSNSDIIRVAKSVDSVSRASLFLQGSPDLKIVHLVRNPFAVVDSRLRGANLGLMPNTSYYQDVFESYGNNLFDISLKELNTLSIEAQYTYEWMVHNHHVIANCSNHRNYFFVSYDKMAAEVKNELTTLFHKLEIPWSAQTEKLIQEMLLSEQRQGDYFGVMRSPKSQLDKWKENLSDRQINDINKILVKSDLLYREFK